MSFPEAVVALLDSEGINYQLPDEKPIPERKPFALPEARTDMRRVFAYLTKTRRIDRDVVQYFAKAKLLYEDALYHNVVFVGTDENGIPRHAHRRSTLTLGEKYRGNVEGSDPRYSFHHIRSSDRLFVFESPIDMMSYISRCKENWQDHSYVALCGISPLAMQWVLGWNQHLQNVSLCLDNDQSGIVAAAKMSKALQQAEYEVFHLQSKEKDWNLDLQLAHYESDIESRMRMEMQL